MENVFLDLKKSTVDKVQFALPSGEHFDFWIKRDDLIDDLISGNKWRKLKYNIALASQKNKDGVITFGGAYSNHLVATAKACNLANLKSIGIVRGEELNEMSNDTLKRCSHFGMKLIFISRSNYSQRSDYDYQNKIKEEHPNFHLVPEGGANFYGVIGCQEILKEITTSFDHVFLSAGTGTTSAGVILSADEKTKIHVVSALKGDFMREEVYNKIQLVINDKMEAKNYLENTIFYSDTNFGGYGKWDDKLIDFANDFFNQTNVKLDVVYTAKTAFKLIELVKNKKINNRSKVLFIHTGGLQGNSSIAENLSY